MSLKIIFFDINKNFIDAYKNVLQNISPNFQFVCDSLENLVKRYPNINAIVSPANSYGYMNGGIDRYINQLLDNVEPIVRDRIEKIGVYDNSGRKFLPIGNCEVIFKNNIFLFVSPTMLTPMRLDKNSTNIFHAFFAVLHTAISSGKNLTIACPCLGTGVGQFDPTESARQVLAAWNMFIK